MARYLYFVGIPHQKIHYRFLRSALGGEYVEYPCTIEEKRFPELISEKDGKDVVWFFSDIYYNLHRRLKGKQVLTKHGLSFGRWLNPRRAECINRDFDAVFQTGKTQEADHRRFGINLKKIKPAGYTLLFELPKRPARKEAVLFSSTCFRHWNHYDNLTRILEQLPSEAEGRLSVHPQTPREKMKRLRAVCKKKPNLRWIRSQEELLEAYAECSYNISGGVSSVCAPFWYQKKPVVFLRGRTGPNLLKGMGWRRIKNDAGEPLFNRVLDESMKLSHWKEFDWEKVRKLKPAPSAKKIFYPSNFSQKETVKLIQKYVKEVRAL